MTWRIRFEPLITPLFHTWWRMSRAMTLGVRGLAQDDEGRILLVKHTYRAGWYLPGGGVERGETAIQSIQREMAEEGGVEATSTPVLIGFYSNHSVFPNDHVALYRFETWRPFPPAPGEIAERGFFALDALPEGVTPGTKRRLAEVFEGAPVSAIW